MSVSNIDLYITHLGPLSSACSHCHVPSQLPLLLIFHFVRSIHICTRVRQRNSPPPPLRDYFSRGRTSLHAHSWVTNSASLRTPAHLPHLPHLRTTLVSSPSDCERERIPVLNRIMWTVPRAKKLRYLHRQNRSRIEKRPFPDSTAACHKGRMSTLFLARTSRRG